MKTEKLVWGLILIFIGGVFLLESFDVIDFYWWRSIRMFWPVILILFGVNMLFSRSDAAASPYVAVVITVLVLGFIAYQGSMPPDRSANRWFNYQYEDHDDDHDDDNDRRNSKWEGDNMIAPLNAGITHAELNIRGGATSYRISDTTSDLVDASFKGSKNGYTLTNTPKDSLQIVNFNMTSGSKRFFHGDNEGNEARLRLNTRPIWDINVNVGAGESKFDLSAFRVGSLDLHGGAASFEAKLGVPPETITRVTANTGMAEVKLKVPASVGCQVRVKSGLSSSDFEGFTKQPDGTFVTSNFKTAAKTIIIDLKGGLSDFNVSRY
ncbi:LiaI-LiaF-like domain-containing protein [Hufsiella ginkgonis]|uniref:LiaI-LiaF-like transmembrane region domain-containing protein n=1 Tax=Hufsiella ginkgonis TaxID=2695274 RepID=A0A7K1Y3U5_9SPHI|nr:DUF5668 domain-containing protein [Hufsiella ginkgonis]MXV17953.1 hypothetical protein [Hufsiella ginkgonis]